MHPLLLPPFIPFRRPLLRNMRILLHFSPIPPLASVFWHVLVCASQVPPWDPESLRGFHALLFPSLSRFILVPYTL